MHKNAKKKVLYLLQLTIHLAVQSRVQLRVILWVNPRMLSVTSIKMRKKVHLGIYLRVHLGLYFSSTCALVDPIINKQMCTKCFI